MQRVRGCGAGLHLRRRVFLLRPASCSEENCSGRREACCNTQQDLQWEKQAAEQLILWKLNEIGE
uniref:Uncharacterized protein n=1 Tax=Arundo donax TaxID=35708 RepID=A0A0A9BGL7_ARUDO